MIYTDKQKEESPFASVNSLIQPRKKHIGMVPLSLANKQQENKNKQDKPEDPKPKQPKEKPISPEKVNLSKKPNNNKHFYTEGIWNNMGNDYLEADLGQVVWITVNNANTLGTTIEIAPNYGEKQAAVILPLSSMEFHFDLFAEEPVRWEFKVSSYSDAFIVGYKIESTWVPGMPPNPDNN